MLKFAKYQLFVINQKGNFLRSPQWCKHPYCDIPVLCDFIQVVTKEEVLTLSAEEIQKRIEGTFVYDDYKYHKESGYKMKCKKRAENIHKIHINAHIAKVNTICPQKEQSYGVISVVPNGK